MERAIEIDEKHFGPDHPNLVTRYSNLAGILRDSGDLPLYQFSACILMRKRAAESRQIDSQLQPSAADGNRISAGGPTRDAGVRRWVAGLGIRP